MGSACCVAARDETIQNEVLSEILHRSVRQSPSWGFRWDNRGRVAGEETSVSWITNGMARTVELENKSETVFLTSQASPAENFHSLLWEESPISERSAAKQTPSSDSSVAKSISMEVKGTTVSSAESDKSAVKLSPVVSSSPSMPTSPLSSQSNYFPSKLTPSRTQILGQASDSQIQTPGFKSPSNYSISEGSARMSHGGSSDGYSVNGFPEFMTTSCKERWSVDSESVVFNRDKPIDLQTCGVCSKLLSEKSSFSALKTVVTNDHSIVAVLICGHIYHAECLDSMTPEISKYDPACPVCSFGEQQVLKMTEKVLKAEMDSKARKRFRNRTVDNDFTLEVKGPIMASSTSMKSSFGTPFLKRHFSLGSTSSKSFTESSSSKKKGFFWTKSRKE